DPYLSRVGTEQAGRHTEGRGLAGTVRADDAEERAGCYVEIDVINRDFGAEGLAQPSCDERRPRRTRSVRGCRRRHRSRLREREISLDRVVRSVEIHVRFSRPSQPVVAPSHLEATQYGAIRRTV